MFKKITQLCFVAMVGSVAAQQSTTVFPSESTWSYLDDGSDLGSAWTAPSYNDASWATGQGEFGYGDGDETTVVSYGPDSGDKYPTTYFRREFNVSALPTSDEELLLLLKRDDGAIVYINGNEVHRVNMPSGPVAYNTYANGTVGGGDEDIFFETVIDATDLVVGNNVVAVEIHQTNATSSDITFDLELAYREIIPLVPPVDCSDLLDPLHISQFTSVMPSVQPDSLRIPSTHTFQMLIQHGEPYTDATQGNTGDNFDFTGYVPIDGSSHKGYLSINHEMGSSPAAGVSMMDIQFDSTLHIWNITNNQPVDFAPVNGTGRNCSGTVTPWGTIITAEETLPSSDANGDGYQDIGWLVEIDPATASVIDHDGDGTPEKLFKLGRMSHENCVVSEDRKTVYYGNDENPGYVFKFVADEEEDLTSGSLYVLKLDGPLDNSTTGTWVGIPNFTTDDCNNVRSYANAVQATNFDKIEDVEISPVTGQVYFTSKSSSRVYRFTDNGSSVSGAMVFVGNSSFIYNIETADGIVEEQWRGGVDNLTFDDEGNLYVIQDGGRNHIWMVPTCHTQTNPAVKMFAVTPAGCEPTGMTFSPDFKFMFVSMQHPSSNNQTEMIDATGTPVIFNNESCIVIARKEYLGPDAMYISPASIDEQSTIDAPTIFPNPTNGNVTIQINANNGGSAMVHVYNMVGSSVRVLSQSLNAGENNINVQMENLPAGVYSAVVVVGNQRFTQKIVKR